MFSNLIDSGFTLTHPPVSDSVDKVLAPPNREPSANVHSNDPSGLATIDSNSPENTRVIARSEAKRGRRSLESMVVRALPHVFDGAASSLSYSSAALQNTTVYQRSMASGALWAVSGLCGVVNQAIFDDERSISSVLSNLANLNAGIASMTMTGLGQVSNPNITAVSDSATTCNVLWATAGTLASASVILNRHRLTGEKPASTLAYVSAGLRFAEGVLNATAAGVSIASTFTSSGNSASLNKLSSGLWMAGTVLGATSTVLGQTGEKPRQLIQPSDPGDTSV